MCVCVCVFVCEGEVFTVRKRTLDLLIPLEEELRHCTVLKSERLETERKREKGRVRERKGKSHAYTITQPCG